MPHRVRLRAFVAIALVLCARVAIAQEPADAPPAPDHVKHPRRRTVSSPSNEPARIHHAQPTSTEASQGCSCCGGDNHHECASGPMHLHGLGHPLGVGGFFGAHRLGTAPQLIGGSWLNRPLTAGIFAGALSGDSLTDGLDQDADFAGGVRFGWDYHDHWGAEMRFTAAAVDVLDTTTDATIGENDIFIWDTSILYYPWGDSRWRPYLSFGLGYAHFDFLDTAGLAHQQGSFEIPIGIGIKYRHRPWSAIRFDLTDHIAFGGSSLDTMQNVTFMFGIDYRFGGDRTMYWPWQPSTFMW